jgi:ADP-ribose pyrophosphatase YjhB (NUDIX family)
MEKQSCGAIFYTFDKNGEIGIILGDESHVSAASWLPFKGSSEKGETYEQTAIREIYEETCGLIKLQSIQLEHRFSTKHKEYRIGLVEVPIEIIEQFDECKKREARKEFLEKKTIKFFPLKSVLSTPDVHIISKASILFYKDRLENNQLLRTVISSRLRYQGISHEKAQLYAIELSKASVEPESDVYTDDIPELYKQPSRRRISTYPTHPTRLYQSSADTNRKWRRSG